LNPVADGLAAIVSTKRLTVRHGVSTLQRTLHIAEGKHR
jgi:hypothetical protein